MKNVFDRISKSAFKTAGDPFMLGTAFVVATCVLPVSTSFAAIAASAPVLYAGVGLVAGAVAKGLDLTAG